MQGSYHLFQVEEDTTFCSRILCGENRGFEFDFEAYNTKQSFVKIGRRYRCCGWAVLPCCAHRVDVKAGDALKDSGLEIQTAQDSDLMAQVQVPMFHGKKIND